MNSYSKHVHGRWTLWFLAVAGGAWLSSWQAASALGGTGFEFGSPGPRRATPINATNLGGRGIIQGVACQGDLNGFVLADDGTVFAEGSNAQGQLGVGTTTDVYPYAPIITTNLGERKIIQVASSGSHSLVLAEDGSVFSFGAGTLIATPIDTTNLGGLGITQIAAGRGRSLILAENGSVYSFGSNEFGATGLGTAIGANLIATPIDTTNLGGLRIIQVASAFSHSLLLAEDGSVFSFGSNASGRTGLGITTGETLVATPIDTTNLGGLRITQVAAGTSHSLLLAEDGRAFSFGSNENGKTGLGITTGDTLVATPIDTTNLGNREVTQVAAGHSHSLVLAEDGRVFSFGSGGQTGHDPRASSSVALPIDINNLIGWQTTFISAGTYHSLIVAEQVFPVGDYNRNEVVDAADYVAWRKTLGDDVTPGTGADGNASGGITQLDYQLWKGRFGTVINNGSMTTAISHAAVPEPPASLLACGMISAAFGQRRKAQKKSGGSSFFSFFLTGRLPTAPPSSI